MTRANLSRDKGAQFEGQVVRLAKEHGLKADRVPASDAAPVANGGILITPTFADRPWRGECKRRKELLAWLVTALDGCDLVALRADRDEAVALISLRTLMEMMQ